MKRLALVAIILAACGTDHRKPTGDDYGNDVPFTESFPYFGRPQMPRDPGTIDDNTRN